MRLDVTRLSAKQIKTIPFHYAVFFFTISLVELWLDLELNATLANFIAFESKFNDE